MIMWIAAILLVAMTVSMGYRQGAIRVAISLVGLMVAAMLALPLAPMFNFIFNFVEVHPLVPQFITPVIAFFAVSWVFVAIGAFAFRKVDYHYRYNVSDAHRAFWERMHRRLGACLGALNGVVYFLVFALFVNVAGYFTVQVGGADSGSKVMSFVTKAAEDLQTTDMHQVVAPFNPAPAKYFEVSDLLGLLYQNRQLKDRLEHYPVFAAMAERPVFNAMGNDPELQKKIEGQSSLAELLENPHVQEVVTNMDIVNELLAVDLKDLRQYLETGVSPKFAEEKILGRWTYDLHESLKANRRARSDVSAPAWFRLKRELTERLDGATFTAFHNNKANLKLSAKMEGKASPVIARPASVLPTNRQTNYLAAWLGTNASYSAAGKWSGTAPNYLVSLGNKNGSATSQAKMDATGQRMTFRFEDKEVSFERVQD